MVVGELVSPKTSHQVLNIILAWQSGPQDWAKTNQHPPSDRPLRHKTKVVVVTGIKKNSDFGSLPTLRKKMESLQSRFFQKGSLTSVRQKFRVKKFRRVFFRLNFFEKSGRGKPTSFWIFDFGGLPFSNHVLPYAQIRNSS